jgi:hypothetical protein
MGTWWYVHSIFLCLELLQKLAIVLLLLLVVRFGAVAIHTFSATIVSFLILYLLGAIVCRVKVLDSHVFLVLLRNNF